MSVPDADDPDGDLTAEDDRECDNCGWTLGPTDGDCPACGWREDPL